MAGYQVQGQYPFNVGAETLETLEGNELVFVANGGALLAQATTATIAGLANGAATIAPSGADDYLNIQTAMTAAAAKGAAVGLTAGMFLLSTGLVWPTGLVGFVGPSGESCIIQRTGAVSAMLMATNQSGFYISGICFDGHKSANATPSNGILLSGCSDFVLSGIKSINQKTGTNFGDGIQLINTPTTNTTGRGIIFDQCQLCDNDQSGLHVVSTGAGIQVQGGIYSNNGLNGIFFDRGTTPVVNTMPDLTINNARAERNVSAGIVVTGFRYVGLNGVYTSGHGNDPACGAVITNNQCNYNAGYGLFAQVTGGTITGNACRYNGTTNQAGICANAEDTAISANVVEYNGHFGIDAGGGWKLTIIGNLVRANTNASGGIGINLGANQHTICNDNIVIDHTTANINFGLNDSGTFWFGWDAVDITVDNNTIINTLSTSDPGILVNGNVPSAFLTNNKFVWPDTNGLNALIPLINGGRISGNTIVGVTGGYTLTTATTTLISDWVDTALVTADGAVVTNILYRQQNTFAGLLTGIVLTNRGSGYTTAPTVNLSGSWSVAPVATAHLTEDGQVAAVSFTRGSGITGAVTVGFTGGGGSGAAATASVGLTPPDGRTLQIIGSASTARLQSNTAIALPAPSGTTITIQASMSATFRWMSSALGLLSLNPTDISVPNNTHINLYDNAGSPCQLYVSSANDLALVGTDASGNPRTIFDMIQRSSSTGLSVYPSLNFGRSQANFIVGAGAASGAANAVAPAINISGNSTDTDVALRLAGRGVKGVLINPFVINGSPSTTDIPASTWGLAKDSGGGGVKLYYNDAGTLKSVALT